MANMQDPIWITADEVAAISVQSVATFGGLSGDVRDENLFNAALGRPLNKWHYDEPKPDLFTLAAAYCFALVKGHVFHDGNKRTAYIVSVVFLELNGFDFSPDQTDIVQTMLGAADGRISEDDLAKWFKTHSTQLT